MMRWPPEALALEKPPLPTCSRETWPTACATIFAGAAGTAPMREVVDLMLRVNARAYVFEAGNVRHEHEYHVWEETRLPDGKVLVPGVVSHATNVLEHPELVAACVGQAERPGGGCGTGIAQPPCTRKVTCARWRIQA